MNRKSGRTPGVTNGSSGYDYCTGEDIGLIAGLSSPPFLSLVPATSVKGAVDGTCATVGCFGSDFGAPFGLVAVFGGVVSSSSGIVGQYVLRTCLSAGRRMGFERKKSMPESRHSWSMLAKYRN
jgi:hypothetical protein